VILLTVAPAEYISRTLPMWDSGWAVTGPVPPLIARSAFPGKAARRLVLELSLYTVYDAPVIGPNLTS